MSEHRSRLFVDKQFQGRLLLGVAAYWSLYHFTLWHLLFLFSLFSRWFTGSSAQLSASTWSLYRDFAADHMGIIVCFFVTLPIFCRHTLKFSHRLAGPLVRFREVMKAMIAGKKVEEVTLRSYDLPSDFLNVFNRLVKIWNTRISGRPESTPAEPPLELVETA